LSVSTSIFRKWFEVTRKEFAEGSKILLDIDKKIIKIILLGHQNNFIEILKIMSNAAKNFDILASFSSVM